LGAVQCSVSGSLSRSTDKLSATMVNTRSNSCSSQDEYNNMTVDDKLNLLIDEVRRIKVGNEQCLSEITHIKEDITKIKNDFTASVDMCFNKIKDCENSVGGNSKRITECETLIDSLRSENIALKESLVGLKRRVAAGEQYSRSNCLEITGVPEARNEDILKSLAKNPNKPESPRGIIVKFCRRVDMEEMRQRAKVKRWVNAGDLGYQSDNKIFINLFCRGSPGFSGTSKDWDIIALIETWLNSSVYNAEPFPDGHQVYRRDRCQLQTGKSRGRGVLIAISNSIKHAGCYETRGGGGGGAAQITDKFAQYFSSVYGHCQLESEELWRRALRSPVMPGVPPMTLGSVTRNEVQQALLKLKPKTSVGPDGLPPYIFKACSELLNFLKFGNVQKRVALLVCLYKLVGGVLGDSALLSKLQFNVPRLNSRSRLLFSPRYSRTNLAANSPLNMTRRDAAGVDIVEYLTFTSAGSEFDCALGYSCSVTVLLATR
ncbi:hypothetical protein J6590_106621, partial [Homalodisca vitripennis]